MRVRWIGLLALLLALAPPARGADHRDGPLVAAEPTADISDVFAWMSADATKLQLLMNVASGATAGARFSDSVQYVFHVSSRAAFNEPDAARIRRTVLVCTFDAAQAIRCWLGPATGTGIGAPVDYASGDAGQPVGLASVAGTFKVFAGLRDDPFSFNLGGWRRVAARIRQAIADPGFAALLDAAGCPRFPAAEATEIRGELASAADGMAGRDDFAGTNVLSIAIVVDAAAVAPGGSVVGVWGSTHRP